MVYTREVGFLPSLRTRPVWSAW